MLIQSGATSDAIYGDVISGNSYGVMVTGAATTDNFIYFNEIGTNAAGTIAIGNQYAGVYIVGSSGNDVLYNTVAYNGYFGILEWSTDTLNRTYYGNTVYGSIYDDVHSLSKTFTRTRSAGLRRADSTLPQSNRGRVVRCATGTLTLSGTPNRPRSPDSRLATSSCADRKAWRAICSRPHQNAEPFCTGVPQA